MVKTDNKKWFMLDLARERSFNRDEITELLNMLKCCGYNGIGLYIEGFFAFPEFLGVPRIGCMTVDDTKWILEMSGKLGLQVMPMTNLVGHAESFISQDRFRNIARDEFQFNMSAKGFRNFAIQVINQFINCFHPNMIHIGGDEVNLNNEERKQYAEFLSDMSKYLKSKGIETGIWGDMLLSHSDIAQMINKNITVFDWWYYGHRFESSKILKNYGFKKIVVCPGTQTWNGIVATQQKCPWRKELRWDSSTTVSPNEVEAFFKDAQKSDINDAMLCDWENYCGHFLWNGTYMIARFGAYLNNNFIDDDSLLKMLFKRKTPYINCINILQNIQSRFFYESEKLPGRILTHTHGVDGVFKPDFMCKILQCGDKFDLCLQDEFNNAIIQVKSLMNKWETKSILEELCYNHLKFAVTFATATLTILKIASTGKKSYHNAADSQFKNTLSYTNHLDTCIKEIKDLLDLYDDLIRDEKIAISNTGHTKLDLIKLNNMKYKVSNLYQSVIEYKTDGNDYNKSIVLPSWVKLVSEVFGKIDINK